MTPLLGWTFTCYVWACRTDCLRCLLWQSARRWHVTPERVVYTKVVFLVVTSSTCRVYRLEDPGNLTLPSRIFYRGNKSHLGFPSNFKSLVISKEEERESFQMEAILLCYSSAINAQVTSKRDNKKTVFRPWEKVDFTRGLPYFWTRQRNFRINLCFTTTENFT